jgi:hypothetical protein
MIHVLRVGFDVTCDAYRLYRRIRVLRKRPASPPAPSDAKPRRLTT